VQSGKTPTVQDYYKDIQAPNIEDMQVQLEQLVQQGTLSPEQAQVFLQGQSQMQDVNQSDETKQAQMDALAGLQDITSSGGMTAQDKALINQIQGQEDARSRGAREAILQNAQARGAGGSGLELMAQLQNQQDSATRAAQRGTDVAAQAQARALQALQAQGQMGSQIGSQQFQQDASKAAAEDAISRFNIQQQTGANQTNVAANNAAQAKNLAAKQQIADQNTGTRNQQQQHNKALIQQQYENELKKRQGQSGVATSNANIAGQNSQNQANAQNQTIGTGLSAAAMFLKDGGLVTEGTTGTADDVPAMISKGEYVIPADKVADYMTKVHTKDNGEFDAQSFLDDLLGNKKRSK
jgi:hypothetical protein